MVTVNHAKLNEMDHNRLFYERLRNLRSPEDTGNDTTNSAAAANTLASVVLNQHQHAAAAAAAAGQQTPGAATAAGSAWGAATGARSPLSVGEAMEERERIKLLAQAKQQQQALQYMQQQHQHHHHHQQHQQQQQFLSAVALRNLAAANASNATAASLGYAAIQPSATSAAPTPAALQLLDSYKNVAPSKDLDVIEINSSDSENDGTRKSGDLNNNTNTNGTKKNRSVGKRKDSSSVNGGALENSTSSFKRKRRPSSGSTEKDDSFSVSTKKQRRRSASLSLDSNDGNSTSFIAAGANQFEKMDLPPLRGSFIKSILSDNAAEWNKIILQVMGTDGELLDEQSIRIATSKILYLATIKSEHGDANSDANVTVSTRINNNAITDISKDNNSLAKPTSTSTSTSLGNENSAQNKNRENDSKNSSTSATDIPSTVTANNPKLRLKDGITISLSDVAKIARNFVEERKKIVRDVAKKVVKTALAEMTQRHDFIVAKVQAQVKNINSTLNQAQQQQQSQQQGNNNDNYATNRKQDGGGGQNTMRRREHRRIVAKLEERHKDQLQKLQMEQERFIIELQKKHQRQMDKLRAQNDDEKIIHSRALNSYLTASCDALRLMKDHYLEKDI
eukprot:CAMPEP_0203667232 /NCGR_PEP_ID=MMETSP0090-20130426/4109_1 /ASSEMBLY_ACC=CAM_ASM_001088 /TAXON_ID=426623 /ORGANISM="Chaetoceros affinis, Strain CCMP159" /LENGTH=620 /DNA_ID=CAMNT_0050531341 /DNA_START=170 /DNA_END=2032 /DNA_ORIENTATION=+